MEQHGFVLLIDDKNAFSQIIQQLIVTLSENLSLDVEGADPAER